MRVFVSHSSKDAAIAAEVCSHIENSGHGSFLAPRDIRSGYEYAEEIINGIDESDVILLLLSEAANSSPHVLREIERAVSKKKPIIVYKLENVTLSKSMEYFLMTHQWLNAETGKGYDEIVQCINNFAVQSPKADNSAIEAQKQTEITQAATAAAKPENSGSRRRTIIFIAAAAVIIAAAGIITAVCLANRGSQPEEASASTSEVQTVNSTSEAKTEAISSKEETHTADAAEITSQENASQTEEISASQTEAAVEVIQPVTQQSTADTTAKPDTTVQPQESSEPEVSAAQAELGDSLMFGTYNGEPIEWRIIRISEDGTQAVVIADDILTMKAYDAAEGGKFNSWDGKEYWNVNSEDIDPDIQRMIRGDNRWEFSNIRTWLNSDRENIAYKDQPPTSQAMAERRNGYHTEAGFLNDFTKNELSAIIQTEIVTNGTVTEDKVFLLSSSEVEWLYEADVSLYTKPTEAAVAQDSSKWYAVNIDAYDIEDHYWWLRDAVPDTACECYYINISYSDKKIVSGNVGLEGYGIRPAMTLDLTSETVKTALENAHGTD